MVERIIASRSSQYDVFFVFWSRMRLSLTQNWTLQFQKCQDCYSFMFLRALYFVNISSTQYVDGCSVVYRGGDTRLALVFRSDAVRDVVRHRGRRLTSTHHKHHNLGRDHTHQHELYKYVTSNHCLLSTTGNHTSRHAVRLWKEFLYEARS